MSDEIAYAIETSTHSFGKKILAELQKSNNLRQQTNILLYGIRKELKASRRRPARQKRPRQSRRHGNKQ